MNLWLFALGVLIFFIIFILLTRARNYRHEVISKKYEKIRDKLTVRERKIEQKKIASTEGPAVTEFVTSLVGIGVVLMIGTMVMEQVRTVLVTDPGFNTSTGEAIAVDTITNMGGIIFPLIAIGIIVLLAFGITRIFVD